MRLREVKIKYDTWGTQMGRIFCGRADVMESGCYENRDEEISPNPPLLSHA
jgi:hypothetical protein